MAEATQSEPRDQLSANQPAIDTLRRNLWRKPEPSGVSVLVGSGLSRLAIHRTGQKNTMPSWGDLAASLEGLVGRTRKADNSTPVDALRIGLEYEALMGRAELDLFLRQNISDEEHVPHPLHRQLVALPWADVLTTNYDTLLERAAGEQGKSLSVVADPRDIPQSRRPRIVKLHGSFPNSRPFIFTEEDYRKYPTSHAPFVNLVRQAAMETNLVLLGFSGDDPNFRSWIGWVRDELGVHGPPVYLVGFLALPDATRRALNMLNVKTIDLADDLTSVPSSQQERHEASLSWFLSNLWAGQARNPARWPDRVFRPRRAVSNFPDIPVNEAWL